MAVLLGLAGVLAIPAAIELARRSQKVALLDAAYAVPLGFVLGLLSLLMARRARSTLRWLLLRDGGTGAATTGVVLGVLAICLALTGALSVAFYELLLLYQSSR